MSKAVICKCFSFTRKKAPSGSSSTNRFFGDVLTRNVDRNKPNTVGLLKTEIETFIVSLPTETCLRAIKDFEKRVEVCIQHQGGDFQHNFE